MLILEDCLHFSRNQFYLQFNSFINVGYDNTMNYFVQNFRNGWPSFAVSNIETMLCLILQSGQAYFELTTAQILFTEKSYEPGQSRFHCYSIWRRS